MNLIRIRVGLFIAVLAAYIFVVADDCSAQSQEKKANPPAKTMTLAPGKKKTVTFATTGTFPHVIAVVGVSPATTVIMPGGQPWPVPAAPSKTQVLIFHQSTNKGVPTLRLLTQGFGQPVTTTYSPPGPGKFIVELMTFPETAATPNGPVTVNRPASITFHTNWPDPALAKKTVKAPKKKR